MRVFERTKTLDLKKEKPSILLQLQRNSSELDEADRSRLRMSVCTDTHTTDNYRRLPTAAEKSLLDRIARAGTVARSWTSARISVSILLKPSMNILRFHNLSKSLFSRRFLTTARPQVVSYLTDLEGDYEYWLRFVRQSKVFKFQEPATDIPLRSCHSSKGLCRHFLSYHPKHNIQLLDDCHFVFGGDLFDRNNGDIRLLLDMLQLKEDYPHRVHFILGNRDVNKLRLLFSLHPSVVSQFDPLVYWIQSNPALVEEAKKEVSRDSPASKLKWILGKTMGAGIAFESRRSELKLMGLPAEDEDVLNSYLLLLQPSTGLLWRFLSEAKIALLLGNNLFVHGALHEHSLGWVPPTARKTKVNEEMVQIGHPERVVPDVVQWAEAINSFARAELEDYRMHAMAHLLGEIRPATSAEVLWEVAGGYEHAQPGSRLIQYAMGGLPGRKANRTVIYASYLRGAVAHYSAGSVADWLAVSGVQRIVVGHQPNGDCPWTLNAHGLTSVSADQAYSRHTLWPLRHFLDYPAGRSDCAVAAGEEFVSYHDFCRRFPEHPAAKLFSAVPQSGADFSQRHSTRAPLACSELLLTFPHGLEVGRPSTLTAAGSLSDGSTYSFSVEPSSFVGMKTKDDWFVKAANVRSPFLSESRSFFLLAKTGESFQFMNRLVDEQQLVRELYG